MAKQRKAPAGTYWRGNTLWGRITVHSREIRWSLRTGDAEVARSRYEARRQREVAAAHYGDARRTWGDAVLAWTDHIAANVSPNTLKRYMVSLRQVEPHLKGCFLDEIDKALVSGIIRDRRRQGAINATIKRDLGAVSSVLGYCEDEDWVDSNPALARLKKLKERRDPIVLPELAHIAYVVERAPGMLARMIEAALTTGCRQNELVTLKRNRVDLPRRQVTVIGKRNKLRTIDMLDSFDVFRATAVHMRSRFVFWHGDGAAYANVASRFAEITRSAQRTAQSEGRDFRRFRFHDLRHRFAVDYLKAGKGSVYDLRDHLGHDSVKTTEAYLKFLTPEEARRAKDGTARNPAHLQRFSDAEGTENLA